MHLRIGRVAALALLAPAGCHFVGSPVAIPCRSSGTRMCTVCGEQQSWERDREGQETTGPAAPGAFARWWTENVGLAHEHEWAPVGCESYVEENGRGTIALVGGPVALTTHAALPAMADQETARRIARGLVRAAPESRAALLTRPRTNYAWFPSMAGLPLEAQAAAWEDLRQHEPLWQEVWERGAAE